ncbi:hypothetical protein NFI96_029251 [Prochilodus magdalenae]|nr:hypothetical protein NFI96_029251 [Prochilodus magdalenae]
MRLHEGKVIKDRRHHLRTYPNCFVAKELIDWLMEHKEASDRDTAIKIMQKLLDQSIIHHVCDEHKEFKDMKLFYRFRKDDGTFPLDSEAKVFMRGQRIYEKLMNTENSLLQTRAEEGVSYERTLVASEFIDWLLQEGEMPSREEAEQLGRRLLEHGIIQHVTNKHHFTDGGLLFQFRMNFRRRRRLMELLHERSRVIPESQDSPFCLRKQNPDTGNGSFLSGRFPQDAAHRMLPTGRCLGDTAHRTLPTGRCPQDASHRTLPTGRCPQDAFHRPLPRRCCPQDAFHRTLPRGCCPQDAAHRTLSTGRCLGDAAHRMLPTGCCPHAAMWTLPRGRCPQDTACTTLPTGHCPQDTAYTTLPTGHCPQDTACTTLPTGHCLHEAAHRTLPTGHCPQDTAHRTLFWLNMSPTKEIRVVCARRSSMSSSCGSSGYYSSSPTLSSSPPVLCNPKSGKEALNITSHLT